MKNVLIIFLMITFNSVINAQSQKYSIEGRFMSGYHYQGQIESPFYEGHFQMNGGIILKRKINDKFGLSTGLQSRIIRRDYIDDIYFYGYYAYSYDGSFRYNYLEIPINGCYKYKGFYVEGGLNINYMLSYSFIYNNKLQSTEKPEDIGFIPGLNLNIGYEIPIGKQFYANIAVYYDYPVFVKHTFQTSWMNYGLYIGLGYNIPQKIKE